MIQDTNAKPKSTAATSHLSRHSISYLPPFAARYKKNGFAQSTEFRLKFGHYAFVNYDRTEVERKRCGQSKFAVRSESSYSLNAVHIVYPWFHII